MARTINKELEIEGLLKETKLLDGNFGFDLSGMSVGYNYFKEMFKLVYFGSLIKYFSKYADYDSIFRQCLISKIDEEFKEKIKQQENKENKYAEFKKFIKKDIKQNKEIYPRLIKSYFYKGYVDNCSGMSGKVTLEDIKELVDFYLSDKGHKLCFWELYGK